jgi:plastocyanin
MTQSIGRRTLCLMCLLGSVFFVPPNTQNGRFFAAEQGSEAEIRGKITLTGKGERQDNQLQARFMGRYPTHAESEAAAQALPKDTAPAKLSELAVVYIEGGEIDRGEYPLPTKKPVLDQRNLQFHPQVLPILVGTTVDFPNRDNLFHNVFSYSSPKEFDLGRYPKDDSRSVTFDKPGTIRVYCDIHSHMAATILVLQHPYFATPGDDGSYVIPNVPEGKYRIVLWYGRDVVERRTITVEAGKSVTADFTY